MPPFEGTAVNTKLAPAQILVVGALIEIVGELLELTFIPILFDTPELLDAQILVFEMTQVIVSKLFNAFEAYEGLLVPTFVPFNFH